ncbi:MAG TPA: hypothetical protein VN282_11510 [Pyrinomonadaceae bacterium]|nr:hypothetical protein [Pyrinomonadaceae bacterium]
MSKYPLAAVVVLALLAGGFAGFVFHYPPEDAADARAGAPQAAEAATPVVHDAANVPEGAGADSALLAGDGSVEAGEAGGDFAGASDERAVRRPGGVRGRAEAAGRAGGRPAAARGYVRVSRAEGSSGGRGIAGHTLGGVKKTGEGVKKTGVVIGRTFGKLGGVFHE